MTTRATHCQGVRARRRRARDRVPRTIRLDVPHAAPGGGLGMGMGLSIGMGMAMGGKRSTTGGRPLLICIPDHYAPV